MNKYEITTIGSLALAGEIEKLNPGILVYVKLITDKKPRKKGHTCKRRTGAEKEALKIKLRDLKAQGHSMQTMSDIAGVPKGSINGLMK